MDKRYLQKFFGKCSKIDSLRSYVQSYANVGTASNPLAEAWQANVLGEQVLVVEHKAPLVLPFRFEREFTQSEIINGAICILLQRNDGNVLTRGFDLLPGRRLHSTFPNTLTNELMLPPWTQLLDFVGDHFLQHLILNCTLLLQLPNSCFAQLSGPPNSHLSSNNISS